MNVHNKDVSPVGWYLCSYICRFLEVDDAKQDNLDQEFKCWENTVLIKAESPIEAFEKTESIGLEHAEPYKGGDGGVLVQWKYEGVSNILPIYEEIEDGAELIWTEHEAVKLSKLKDMLLPNSDAGELTN